MEESKRLSLRKLRGRFFGEFSLRPHTGPSRTWRLVRSWKVLLFTAIFIAPFTIPYFTIATMPFDEIDDLFDLVFVLFNAFWFLGWTVAVALMLGVFLVMLFARERVIYQPGRLVIRLEIMGIGFSRFFAGDEIIHLQRHEPEAGSGIDWRGPHMTFRNTSEGTSDAGELVSFGCDVSTGEADALAAEVRDKVCAFPAVRSAPEDEIKHPSEKEMAHAAEQSSVPDATPGSLSSVALLAANLVPVFGVIFLGWSVGEVMLLFWAESAVIAIYNLAKMWVIGRWAVLFMGPFFIGHFGAFMAGHLLFIYGFMIEGPDSTNSTSLATVMQDFVTLLPALGAFFVSHGISFRQNFLGRREYLGRKLQQQMSEPYKRIFIMHITLIIGGFLVLLLESPVPALVLMITLKIAADLRSHLSEHSDKPTQTNQQGIDL